MYTIHKVTKNKWKKKLERNKTEQSDAEISYYHTGSFLTPRIQTNYNQCKHYISMYGSDNLFAKTHLTCKATSNVAASFPIKLKLKINPISLKSPWKISDGKTKNRKFPSIKLCL